MGTVKNINHYMLPHTLDDFIEEDTLGSGAYGDVVRMREKSTKHPFAMKICPNNEETRRHLINEILIHGDLYHPNIPRFYGWISSERDSEKQLTNSPTGSQGTDEHHLARVPELTESRDITEDEQTLKSPNLPGRLTERLTENDSASRQVTPNLPGRLTENDSASRQVIPSLPGKYIHLFFECIPGEDLHTIARHHYKQQSKWLPEEDVRLVIEPLLNAIEYVHNAGYIHRDIKTENVMIREPKTDNDEDWSVYLIDFGLSIRKEDAKAGDTAGTLEYLSPEIVMASMYDEKIDIWALGVMMVELLCGDPPFKEDTLRELARASRMGDSATLSEHKGELYAPHLLWTLSEDCRDLLLSMLTVDPKQRATIKEIRQSKWMRKS